jgi:hypothetical protein
VFLIVLSCLLVIIHSTAELDLSLNSLMGTIPSEVGLMSNLCELSVVCLLVVMIVLSCVFHCNLMLVIIFHSTDWLSLYNNSFTGKFTCPDFISYCRISCDDSNNDTCRSL